MSELLSYHSDAAIKAKYLERVIAHAKADNIVKGVYWEKGKGCAIGCTIHGNQHIAYETELGIPEWLARLEDKIFEGLPNDEAKEFPRQFLEAVPVGKDLTPVKWKFCAYILKENIERVLLLDIADGLKKQVVDAIRQSLALHEGAITTGAWDKSAAAAAESAAESARSAVWSAAASAARLAAESAAWSAAWSAARLAAESAAWSARSAEAAESAESAARSAYIRYRDELLRLLQEEA